MIEHGISDFGAVTGTVAATNMLQGGLSLVSAATAAGASAIMPPGSEGASLFASVKQKSNVVGFIESLEKGLAEMTMRNQVVTYATNDLMTVDVLNAAVTQSVDAAAAVIRL